MPTARDPLDLLLTQVAGLAEGLRWPARTLASRTLEGRAYALGRAVRREVPPE